MASHANAKGVDCDDGEVYEPNPSVVTQKITEFLQSEEAVSVSDVSLISSDGVRIPAIRALLIIRSPFFKKLFTCDFVEKNSSDVDISLRATPLRNVLEFIYTDDCALIRDIRGNQSNDTECDVKSDDVIELALAADYVQVPKLLSWCKDALLRDMRRSSSSLCINLHKLNSFGATWAISIKEFAFTHLVESPSFPDIQGCDTSNVIAAVVSLDDHTLENILKQTISKSQIRQEVLFQILLLWTNGWCQLLNNWSSASHEKPEVFVDVSKMNLSESNRLSTAKRIANIFDLTNFSAKCLYEVVEKSRICNLEDIFCAYRGLALKAHPPYGVPTRPQCGHFLHCTPRNDPKLPNNSRRLSGYSAAHCDTNGYPLMPR